MDTDLDDTHLCIKCNATILGIDNYVSHRKRKCVMKTDQVSIQPKAATPEPSQQPGASLHGHTSSADFVTNPSFSNHHSVFSPHHHTEHLPSLGTLDPEHHGRGDYDYDLGADFFFSSLELQSKLRAPTASVGASAAGQSAAANTGAVATVAVGTSPAPLDGHMASDGTANLMRAVRAISGNRKCDADSYQMLRISQDSPPNFAANDDDDDNDHGNRYAQASDDLSDSDYKYSEGDIDDAEDDCDNSHELEGDENVPLPSDDDDEMSDDGKSEPSDDEDDIPPPSYTKGKWIPGSKIVRLEYKTISHPSGAAGTDGERFHCRVCDRALSNRVNYERHLTSDLHLKRSMPEHELDVALRDSPRINVQTYADVDGAAKVQIDSSGGHIEGIDELKEEEKEDGNSSNPKRSRRKVYIKCDICKTRMAREMLGKHLISQYHYRRMCKLENPYEQIIRHFSEIVRHSPFQCQPCGFYAITADHFVLHWKSDAHVRQVEDSTTHSLFWCSDCKFKCPSNGQMAEHLVGEQHQGLIETINRSVPIIIRQMQPIKCVQCGQSFQLNVQLRQHVQSCSQVSAEMPSTSSDQYQSKFQCNSRLPHVFFCRSQRSLQEHMRKTHSHTEYFCSICNIRFETPQAAREHRSTIEHKVRSNRLNGLKVDGLSRKCRSCGDMLADLVELKAHIRSVHPTEVYKCPQCGISFALQQEISRHVRDGPCVASDNQTESADKPETEFKCNLCVFRTPSEAEYIFHEVLHSVGKVSRNHPIECPRCQKSFTKRSLRMHLQQHTNERQFKCEKCNIPFARKQSWRVHMQQKHENSADEAKKATDCPEATNAKREGVIGNRRRKLKTPGKSECKAQKVARKTAEGNAVADCIAPDGLTGAEAATAATVTATAIDAAINSTTSTATTSTAATAASQPQPQPPSMPPHACPQCGFRTAVAARLRRHLLVHTGEKPFACPHCNYTCNNVENLRKHVLSTRRHPGRHIYECPNCPANNPATPKFCTNFQKDFNEHLRTEHGGAISMSSA